MLCGRRQDAPRVVPPPLDVQQARQAWLDDEVEGREVVSFSILAWVEHTDAALENLTASNAWREFLRQDRGHGFCSDLIPKGKQDGGKLKPKGKQEGGHLKPKG